MKKYEAEKIINRYGGAIAQNKSPFKKKSTLPCSKAKIRQAFFVYIPAILDDMGQLPANTGEPLVATYSMLDAFVEDKEAERLNQIPSLLEKHKLDPKKAEDKKEIDEYFSRVTNALRNGEYFDEINDFIEECYRERKTSPDPSASNRPL